MPVLTLAGALILFCSWLAEKSFKAKAADELAYLEKSQELIAIEEGRMNQWLIQLNLELARSPRDDKLLSAAALKMIQATANLRAWSEARLGDSPESKAAPIADKDQIGKKASAHFNRGETGELVAMAKEVAANSDNVGSKLTNAFKDRVAATNRRNDVWSAVFLVLYVTGSTLLAAAWILATFRGWPAKVEKVEAPPPSAPVNPARPELAHKRNRRKGGAQ